jgi:heat-inducible transcriptional repressor
MSEGTIWKQNIKTAKAVKQTDLRKIENVVNQYCAGAKGNQLRERAQQCYEAIKSSYKQDLLLKIVSALSGLKKEEKIIVEGASNLLKEPEFGMVTKVRELFSFLDEQVYLANLLSEVAKSESLVVKIGSEFSNVCEELSFIGKTFSVNGAIGTLGIFGPRRMNYPQAISTVDRMADALTVAFENGA